MFSIMLNVRSGSRDAAIPISDPGTARHDLVLAAIELVGERGWRATTVRAVAERAGVSAPLVMHHFGSKEGLLAACDDHVRALMRSAVGHLSDGMGDEASVQALLAIPDIAPTLGYVGRSLQDGGEVGRWWFDEMMRLSLDGLAGAEAAGRARRSDDPEMRAVLLIAMDLGMVLMRPLVEGRLGAPLTDPTTVERWVRTEFDVLTHGVMIPADERAAADPEETP